VTPALSERPQLDICRSFQSQSSHSQRATGSVVTSTSSGGSNQSTDDTFEVKRRRLLQQEDWVGLDIAAPIKVLTLLDRLT